MAKIKTVEEVLERATQLDIAYLDKNGHEVVDSTPMAPPLGYVEQPSMMDMIAAQVRASRLEAELDALEESEEDADDFEIHDDTDALPGTPWENDKEPSLKDARKRAVALEQALAEAEAIEAAQRDGDSVKSPGSRQSPSKAPETPTGDE